MYRPYYILLLCRKRLGLFLLPVLLLLGGQALAQSQWQKTTTTETISSSGACSYGYRTTIFDTACDIYGWDGGSIPNLDSWLTGLSFDSQGRGYKETNIFTNDGNYCDSIIRLYLDLRTKSVRSFDTFACDSFYWSAAGIWMTSNGSRTEIVDRNVAGCDSMENVVLRLGQNGKTMSPAQVRCDKYTWPLNQTEYTASNHTDYITRPNSTGCTDTITINLTINYSTTAPVQNVTECIEYTWDWTGERYTSSTDKTITHPNANSVNCDSTRSLHLIVNYADTLRTSDNVCDSYTWEYNNRTYTETTKDTLSTTNQYSCDSTMILDLVVRFSTIGTLTDNVVENDLPVYQMGQRFDNEVSHSELHGTNRAGCDSTLDYTLHITWNKADTIDSTVCANEHLPFVWHTYNWTSYPKSSGDTMLRHTMPGAAAGGADSAVSLRLHINPSYDNNIALEECEPYSYTFKSITYNTPGTYTDVDNNHTTLNCDSITHFSLTINANTTSTVKDTIVIPGLPYDYYDLHFDETDIHGTGSTPRTTVIENAKGCDSTITYHLYVHPNSTHIADSTICENNLPMTWNGEQFTSQGMKNATLQAAFQAHGVHADSIVTMLLHVNPNTSSNYDTTVLENDLGTFSFHGYTPTGAVEDHPIMIPNDNGCDSIIYYTVNVRWNKRTNIDTFICANLFPYTWRGLEFTGIQNKEITLPASDGTDSILTLRMHSFKAYDYTVDSAVCQGTSVRWGSNTFSTTIFHTDSLRTVAHNCDSVVRLNLTVDTPSHATHSNTIVQNQLPWTFFGQTFNNAVTNHTVIGRRATYPYCDSIVTYTLTVHANVSASDDSTICYSALPITWNGVNFTREDLGDSRQGDIVHSTTLTAISGADSLLTMTVHVNPNYITYDTMNSCLDDADAPIWWRHTVLNAPHPSGDYSLDTVTTKGCDSLFRLRLELRGNTSSTVVESIVENDLPYTYHDKVFTTFVTDSLIHIQNRYGCDSAVTYTLKVRMNVFVDAYDTICFSQLPFTWNEKRFYAASLSDEEHRTGDIIQQAVMLAASGADSTITMHLHVYPTFDTTFRDTICDDQTYTFNGQQYSFPTGVNQSRNWSHNDTLQSIKGCDSVSIIRLRLHPTYDQQTYDTIYSPQLPYEFGERLCTQIGDYRYGTISQHGCDSVNTLHLWVIQVTFFDTSVCQNRVPFTWHTKPFSTTKKDTLTLTGIHGEDSLIVMDVTILDTSAYYDVRSECDVYTWQNGLTYTVSTASPFVTKTNRYGCDSVVHLDLTMHYSTTKADHIIACNSHTWINGVTYESTIYGPQKMLRTVWGCDSLVTLDLYISYSTYDEYLDSMCLGGRYNFRGRTLTRAGTYVDSLLTVEHCDSVTVLHLAELPSPLIEFTTLRDCDENLYTITVETDVDYVAWSSSPFDSTLLGQEHNNTVVINPSTEVTYTLYADYLETPTCPSTATFSLGPLRRPKAELRTSPNFLTYENQLIEANDVGESYDYRLWYVNGHMQPTKEAQIYYQCDMALDSVVIMLEVTSGFCKDSAYATIMVQKPTLFVPTVFTPYLSTNKVFKPQGTNILEFEMHIYNRKGQQMFETRDINEGWNGKSHDKYCEQGSYVYTIRYRDTAKPDSYQDMTGTVLLLR